MFYDHRRLGSYIFCFEDKFELMKSWTKNRFGLIQSWKNTKIFVISMIVGGRSVIRNSGVRVQKTSLISDIAEKCS